MRRVMRFLPPGLWLLISVLAGWLLTGVYLVGGKERAAVRRFGRVLSDDQGHVLLKRNGLHFDWPWPFSQVDRVNLNEVRTLKVPLAKAPPKAETETLLGEHTTTPAFLTGDKNLLHIQLAVHYRVAENRVGDFLYASVSVDDRLACLTETLTTQRLSRSGVDYVQAGGLSELRKQLAAGLQHRADQQKLGVVIEDVALENVSPPVQVKADFLDVANARAEREQFMQAAQSESDQTRASAQAKSREIQSAAQSQGQEIQQAAKGKAARFLQWIEPWPPSDSTNQNARQLVLERYTTTALIEILARVKAKVILDFGQDVDLTIWRSLVPSKTENR